MDHSQFSELMSVLKNISQTLVEIKKDMPAPTAFKLDDIYMEIMYVKHAVNDVERAIGNISSS